MEQTNPTNWFLLAIIGSIAVIWLAVYLSPRALRHVAAWCLARASGIEHQARVKVRLHARFSLTRARPKPEYNLTRQPESL